MTRPIIANSPERKRNEAGRVIRNENSRSVQCRTSSTVSVVGPLALAAVVAALSLELIGQVLIRGRDRPGRDAHGRL